MYNPPTRGLLLMEKTRAIAQIKGLNFVPPAATSILSQESFSAGGTPHIAMPTTQAPTTGVPAGQTKVVKGSYGELIIIVVVVFTLGVAGAYLLELYAEKRKEQRKDGQ